MFLLVTQRLTFIIPGSRQASIGRRVDRRGLRGFRAYGRVPSLHLERGEGLWPQNKKKDLSFVIGEAGVGQTVHLLLRMSRRGHRPTSRLHPPIRHRVREFLSPFHLSSFLWVVPC